VHSHANKLSQVSSISPIKTSGRRGQKMKVTNDVNCKGTQVLIKSHALSLSKMINGPPEIFNVIWFWVR
jgi:hypothetical protein